MTKQELTSQIDAIVDTIENLPDYSTLKRAELIETAKSHFLKIGGKTPNKNNTINQLLEALNTHKHTARVTLQNKLEALQTEIAAIIDAETAAAQEQEQTVSAPSEEQEEEQDSALVVGREIVVDMINPTRGYHKLETPYILKIVSMEGPASIEIYFEGKMIDTAATVKAARQKIGHHAGPWTLPEGYEVRKEEREGVEYHTAYFKGAVLVRGNGKRVSYPTAKSNSTKPRCEQAIYQHSQGLLK